jgi:hypothetical protein
VTKILGAEKIEEVNRPTATRLRLLATGRAKTLLWIRGKGKQKSYATAPRIETTSPLAVVGESRYLAHSSISLMRRSK